MPGSVPHAEQPLDIIFSISKHNTRKSWNADKNVEWMWGLINKKRFKLQDIFLDVSLLSDACFGRTWFHQWWKTDFVTRWALRYSFAPSFHGSHGWAGMASWCMTCSLQGNENDYLTIDRIIICYTVTKIVLKMFIISLY